MSNMIRALLTFVSVLFISSTVISQDDTSWHVLLFDGDDILTVTADGASVDLNLPEGANEFTQGNTYYNVALSSDQAYFAFVDEIQEASGFHATLNIADLVEETCCRVIPAPDGGEWEVISLLGFSPDGHHLLINFLNAYYVESDSIIAILDVATGEYEKVIDPYELFNTNAIFLIDWHEDGIEIVPSCFPCGASLDGQTTLWNLETDELTPDYGFNVEALGSRLANGEVVQVEQSDNYPIGNADVMMGPFNVIQYFVDDNVEDTTVIYFDADNLNLIKPEWVIDGEAYVIQHQFGEEVTLVWRNGEVQVIEFDGSRMFLSGTPDGWLMTDFAIQKLYQYQWLDGELVETELGEYKTLKFLTKLSLGNAPLDPPTEIITPEA